MKKTKGQRDKQRVRLWQGTFTSFSGKFLNRKLTHDTSIRYFFASMKSAENQKILGLSTVATRRSTRSYMLGLCSRPENFVRRRALPGLG